MATHRRGPWSQGEDSYLVQLVHTQGALNWVRIAHLIGSRSPKQCRERYHQNLKPSLNHEPISPEEGLLIERLVGEMGKRWAEIARRLHGRSDNAVKNWWNGSMNRRRRLVLRRRTSSSQCAGASDEQPQHSYPRPAAEPHAHALTVKSSGYTMAHGSDAPLPSPCVSEASRAESYDGAPSLVSDSGSTFSVSPRLTTSPMIELPYPGPAGPSAQATRKPSVPAASQFRTNSYVPDADGQGQQSYAPHPQTVSPQYRQAGDSSSSSYSPRDNSTHHHHHHHNRAQLPTAPPTPLQLPPLQLTARLNRQEQLEYQGERDSRMNLSSLLG